MSLASVVEGDLRRRSTAGSMDASEISHTKRLAVAVTTLCDCKVDTFAVKPGGSVIYLGENSRVFEEQEVAQMGSKSETGQFPGQFLIGRKFCRHLCSFLPRDGDDHDADGVLAHVVEDAAVEEDVDDERVDEEHEVEEGEGEAAGGTGVRPPVGDAPEERRHQGGAKKQNPCLKNKITTLLFLNLETFFWSRGNK